MLCICTNIPEELKNDSYEVGKLYRVCDGEKGWKFVYGVQMNGKLYKDNFRKPTPQELYDRAVEIYQEKGQYAVFDFANEAGIKEYKYCEPCETDSPSADGECCLVCGSSL